MGAAELRSLVTIPLEDALSSVKGVREMQSISRDGSSLITLDFGWDSDPSAASAPVREAVDAVYTELPEGIQKPRVFPGESGAEPHAIIAVHGLRGERDFERKLAEYELRNRFRSIAGAGNVILAGGEESEERIFIDMPGLAARGMGAEDFVRLLASETAEIPAGNAREGNRELVVVSSARPVSVDELSKLILPGNSGQFALSDAAVIERRAKSLTSLFLNGERLETALEIYRRPGADPVSLSREIKRTLKECSHLFAGDAELSLLWDSSGNILKGIRNLVISVLFACAAVIGALLLFMGGLRRSLLAALSVPLSMAAGICVLALSGKSLNSMSLGGLALGVGLVSDTSVIVLDLLHRNFGVGIRPLPAELGRVCVSVAGSSFASTITTAVVFLPIVFLPGPLGKLYGDVSIALVASITMGWIYAQFCLPPLYRLSFRTEKKRPAVNGRPEKIYGALLLKSIRRPLPVFTIAAAAAIAGAFALFVRPPVFVNPDEAEEILVTVSYAPGTLLAGIGEGGKEIVRLLSPLEGIERIFGRAGSEDTDAAARSDIAYRREDLCLRCVLKKGAKAAEVLSEIQGALEHSSVSGNPRLDVSFPRDRTERILGLSSARTLVVRGRDREEMQSRLLSAQDALKTGLGPLVSSISQRPLGLRPELRFFPDREAAAWLGINTAQIAGTLGIVTEGVITTRLEIEGSPLDVRVSGSEKDLVIDEIPMLGAAGDRVFLGSLGRIEKREAEAALARQDRSDVVYLDVVPLAGREKAVSAAMGNMVFPAGLSRSGESAFTRYRSSLIITIILVLVLLYLTMGAQFESFILPVIFMITIPFSLAGAGPCLFLSGLNPDSGAVLGLTVLFGIVVNNGIVLYEISADLVCQGLSPASAAYTGARERLRPVLITAATTVFALLPLVISPLGNSQRTMALAMLGGMTASTLITLLALPPVFIPFLRRYKNG
jgi:multidrug efflux pump subunit AcrB